MYFQQRISETHAYKIRIGDKLVIDKVNRKSTKKVFYKEATLFNDCT